MGMGQNYTSRGPQVVHVSIYQGKPFWGCPIFDPPCRPFAQLVTCQALRIGAMNLRQLNREGFPFGVPFENTKMVPSKTTPVTSKCPLFLGYFWKTWVSIVNTSFFSRGPKTKWVFGVGGNTHTHTQPGAFSSLSSDLNLCKWL